MKKPKPWKPDGPFTIPVPRCGVCNCKALEVKEDGPALVFKCWACGVTDRLTAEMMEPRSQHPERINALLVKMGAHLERGKRGSRELITPGSSVHHNPDWAVPLAVMNRGR